MSRCGDESVDSESLRCRDGPEPVDWHCEAAVDRAVVAENRTAEQKPDDGCRLDPRVQSLRSRVRRRPHFYLAPSAPGLPGRPFRKVPGHVGPTRYEDIE